MCFSLCYPSHIYWFSASSTTRVHDISNRKTRLALRLHRRHKADFQKCQTFLELWPLPRPPPLTTRRMTVKNLAAHRPEPRSGNWNCINHSLSWGPLWCARCRIYLHVSSMFAAINTAKRWILARCAAIHHCHHRPWIYDNTLEGWSLSRRWSNNAASTVIGSVKWVLTKLDEFAV